MDRAPQDLPNPLWLLIPAVLIPLGLYARSLYQKDQVKRTGIGRGAPGFQTGVQKAAVPREIAERIKRGEEVSAEEITAAMDGASAPIVTPLAAPPARSTRSKVAASKPSSTASATNEWVPDHLQVKPRTRKSARNKA